MTKPINILKKGVDYWNKWRIENPYVEINLSKVDLSRRNLSSINLTDVNLSGANFKYTNLEYAYLSRSNLSWCNLYNANLFLTNLNGTNLSYSNLTQSNLLAAKLIKTNLSKAELADSKFLEVDLSETDLSEAKLTRTIFFSANLSKVNFKKAVLGHTVFTLSNLKMTKNLETVIVKYKCPIDFETLKSSSEIPKEFLSKIGLPDSYIKYLPEFMYKDGISLYPCFLSHSSKNKDFAISLYNRLTQKDVKVWYDEKKIKPGDFIREEIHKGVNLYDKMILVCSKDSLSSWWVEQEIDRYEEKENAYWKQHGEKISLIIPIAIDEEVFISRSALAPNLRKRNIADFRNYKSEKDYKIAFDSLLSALNVNRTTNDPTSFLK